MPKTVQPAVATNEIAFELERFELEDGRLNLRGRWSGVRGRRFVRPTLTPLGGRDLSRMLADLEHKPWIAEDGESWEAAFPWDRGSSPSKFELSVSPDIVIQLPSPSSKLALPRRLVAPPRKPEIMTSWRRPEPAEQEPPPAVEVPLPKVDVDELKNELALARAELDAAQAELADRLSELEALRAELADAQAARENASRRALDAAAESEQLKGRDEQLAREHLQLKHDLEQLVSERDQLTVELAIPQQTIEELRSELQHARAALERTARERDEAARQRDDAVAAHGAALVMRRATRAGSHPSGHQSWWRQVLAVLALIGVVFAILIVAHVL